MDGLLAIDIEEVFSLSRGSDEFLLQTFSIERTYETHIQYNGGTLPRRHHHQPPPEHFRQLR